MLDTGCETITVTKSVVDAAQLYVDRNTRWGLITATGHHDPFYGVVHDCKVTVGGISRLCQVWVMDTKEQHGIEQILLGRPWQRAVNLILEHNDGDVIMKINEYPDGSGKRIEVLAQKREETGEKWDIGNQPAFSAGQNRLKYYIEPDLSYDTSNGGSKLKANNTPSIDSELWNYFAELVNKTPLPLEYLESVVQEIEIIDEKNWFKCDGQFYLKEPDDGRLLAIFWYLPTEKGIEFAKKNEFIKTIKIAKGQRAMRIPMEGTLKKKKTVSTKIKPIAESGFEPGKQTKGKSEEEIVAEIRSKKING
ncbi:hypothetical protein HK096_000768, partial [Nowakowskiella sp. JEL0078]